MTSAAMPEAHVVHRTSGRVRLNIPSKKKDRDFFAASEAELRKISAVKEVFVNPLTGSLVIRYKGKWAPLREQLNASSLLLLSNKKRRRKGDAISRAFVELGKLDKKVERATDSELNLKNLVGLTLLGLSAVQVFRRQLLPPASALLSEGLMLLAVK